jgi:hypothetical protein
MLSYQKRQLKNKKFYGILLHRKTNEKISSHLVCKKAEKDEKAVG